MHIGDFFNTAVKTLENCESRFSNIQWDGGCDKQDDLRSLFVDLAFVLEQFTYYIAYQYGGFKDKFHINKFEKSFTTLMCVDFYPREEVRDESQKFLTLRGYEDFQTLKPLSDDDRRSLNSLEHLYSVLHREHKDMKEFFLGRTLIYNRIKHIPFYTRQYDSHVYNAEWIKKAKKIEELQMKLKRRMRKKWGCSEGVVSQVVNDDKVWRMIDPFLNKEYLQVMLDICNGIDGAIPEPNG